MIKGALISMDQQYRYVLWRIWDEAAPRCHPDAQDGFLSGMRARTGEELRKGLIMAAKNKNNPVKFEVGGGAPSWRVYHVVIVDKADCEYGKWTVCARTLEDAIKGAVRGSVENYGDGGAHKGFKAKSATEMDVIEIFQE